MKVKDIMSRDVTRVSSDTSLKKVSSLMKEYDIGFIVVIDDDNLNGVITDRDIVIRSLMTDGNESVDKYMTKDVITISADEDIEDALALLAENKIKRLVVTNENKVVGILSISDILNSSFNKDILYCIEEIKSPIDILVVHDIDIPEVEVDTFEL